MPLTSSLHIGINYGGTDSELRGCINDAENLRDFMVSTKRVDPEHTRMLEEPTGAQIISAFNDLAAETHARQLQHVFISYSGHGVSVRDDDNDERDRCDECICPADYASNGLIRDDEMADLLKAFNPQTKITMLMDCCHSGSCMDLPFRYLSSERVVVESTEKASHPHVIMVSGCMDQQTSADSYDSSRREMTGAMTSAFLDVLTVKPEANKDAFSMIVAMRALLRRRRMQQVPQLSTSSRLSGDLQYMW
jgi:hypothetical protein